MVGLQCYCQQYDNDIKRMLKCAVCQRYFHLRMYYVKIYSVSQQKSPVRLSKFLSFFHKQLRIFNRFLHTYYTFICMLDYKFLFSYLQL